MQYSAVPQTEGAPLRTVTVKDVISDLPPISNGQCEEKMEYSGLYLLMIILLNNVRSIVLPPVLERCLACSHEGGMPCGHL